MSETEAKVRKAIRDALRPIAPEVDLEQVDPTADFREEADLDSVDVMDFLTRLHQSLGVDIPESDYGRITTLDDLVDYLVARLGD